MRLNLIKSVLLLIFLLPVNSFADSTEVYSASSLNKTKDKYIILTISIDTLGDAYVAKTYRAAKEGDNTQITFVGFPEKSFNKIKKNTAKVKFPKNKEDFKSFAVEIELLEPPSTTETTRIGGWVIIYAKSVTYIK